MSNEGEHVYVLQYADFTLASTVKIIPKIRGVLISGGASFGRIDEFRSCRRKIIFNSNYYCKSNSFSLNLDNRIFPGNFIL
jgi:hypothetical protein